MIDGELCCERVKLAALAERWGTPLYVYSRATLARHFRVFDAAFEGARHRICYSVKANSSRALMKLLFEMGAGADVVSGGELRRALEAGVDPGSVVYSGVGKTPEELALALEAGILMFNVESAGELEALAAASRDAGRTARIAIRVNPDVDPRTHPHVATGLRGSKFGVDAGGALDLCERAQRLAGLEVVGVDCHIGSQLVELGPFTEAAARLGELIAELRGRGFEVRYLDLGGGLGIPYGDERPPQPSEYARAVREALGETGVELILEPGRNLMGNVGVLLARVLYVKRSGEKRFAVVDAGMNDLIRPALYDSYHGVEPVRGERDGPRETIDVVGPICESADYLARDRSLPALEPGELLAVMSAGAYGFSMASTYNSRPLPAEVLVDGERAALIRERGSDEDLTRGERDAVFDPV